MLFNSVNFIVFLLVVTTLYYLIPKQLRIYLILVASYVFYGYLIPLHTLLLIIVTISAYSLGLKLYNESNPNKRKRYLIIAIFIVLTPLLSFKYLNFLIENINQLAEIVIQENSLKYIDIILPIGISFYTMQALSYLIDIYRNEIKPEIDLRIFSVYLSFFPQILAGPIERANKLIPQLKFEENFDLDRFSVGARRVLWGFFKKIVIADKLALIIDPIYNNPNEYSGIVLGFCTYLYAFQIYCDFSGYVDIALGTGKIFGIRLSENFNKPYNASSIKEFWHSWHITLSTWFRDYLYIPLGGKKAKGRMFILSILIVFAVSGLWHGANYTFLIWGLLHGLYYLIERYTTKIRQRIYKAFNINKGMLFLKMIKVFIVFNIVTFAWIFFRATDLSDAVIVITKIADISMIQYFHRPDLMLAELTNLNFISKTELFLYPLLLLIFIIIENSRLLKTYLSEIYKNKIQLAHLLLIDFIILTLIFLSETGTQKFIYFQF